MTNLFLKHVRRLDPVSKTDTVGDLIVRAGILQSDGASTEGLPQVEGRGLLVAPGLWDTHVHFRDPGNPAAETRRTGAEAAAAGGFTHVVPMPNTVPAGDSITWLAEQLADDLPVTLHPSACLSVGRQGRSVSEIETLAQHGAACFTDDGSYLFSDDVMREAMVRTARVNKTVFDHAVVPELAKDGVIRHSEIASALNLPVFPPEAEVEAIARDIRLCRETKCPLVIQHISTAAGVELVRQARAEGLPVSAEASPHHLALAVEEIPGDDGNWRMNPPLGTRTDRAAIRKGVLDGTLSLFATDHAPHTFESKSKGFLKAPFGVIGLETAIGVTWKAMVEEEGMSVMDWVTRWTLNPATILGLPLVPFQVGQPADFVVIDPSTPWTVQPETFRSRSRNCPFIGQTLHARAVLTICKGVTTYRTLNSQPQ